MQKAYVPPVDTIIARTINETARGDPEALASRIVPALAAAGYCIVLAKGIEASPVGSQQFDELKPEMRPRDTYGDAGIGFSRR